MLGPEIVLLLSAGLPSCVWTPCRAVCRCCRAASMCAAKRRTPCGRTPVLLRSCYCLLLASRALATATSCSACLLRESATACCRPLRGWPGSCCESAPRLLGARARARGRHRSPQGSSRGRRCSCLLCAAGRQGRALSCSCSGKEHEGRGGEGRVKEVKKICD